MTTAVQLGYRIPNVFEAFPTTYSIMILFSFASFGCLLQTLPSSPGARPPYPWFHVRPPAIEGQRDKNKKLLSLTKTKRLHRAHSSAGCSSSVRTATKPAHSWRRERTPSAAAARGGDDDDDDSSAPLPAPPPPPLPLRAAVVSESAAAPAGVASRPSSASASAERHSSKKAQQMDRSRCACRALEAVPPVLARWAAACWGWGRQQKKKGNEEDLAGTTTTIKKNGGDK